MIEFDFSFPHTYEIDEVGDFPGTGKFNAPIIYIPAPKIRREHSGLWLKIKAQSGSTWVGVFAFGYTSPPAFSRVLSSPDPKRVCVVSKGGAYLVNAGEPEDWEEVRIIPVLDVRPIVEQNVLILSDFNRIAAYGTNGLVWRSQQICFDDLRITNITNNAIEGTGYDPTALRDKSRFAVDIRTGRSLIPSPFAENE